MSALIVGLDIHNGTYATVIDREGRIVKKNKIKNDDIIGFIKGYDIEAISMESSSMILPIYKKIKGLQCIDISSKED